MSLMQVALIFFILIIVVLVITALVDSSRFTKATSKDTFKNRSDIGNENVGRERKPSNLQSLAKTRNLSEAKKMEPKMPISKATLATSRAVIEVNLNQDKDSDD